MMSQNSLKPVRPLLIVFILLSAFFVTSKSLLLKWNAEPSVLIIGILVIFLMVFISFLLLQRSIYAPNPHVFVRAMYISLIIKFFVLLAAVFIYIQIVGKEVSKPAIFGCLALYFVYTFIEIRILMNLLKRNKNA